MKLIDDFTNPKTGKTSNCFRIAYRSNERSLTDDEINELQVRHLVGPLRFISNGSLLLPHVN